MSRATCRCAGRRGVGLHCRVELSRALLIDHTGIVLVLNPAFMPSAPLKQAPSGVFDMLDHGM